MDKYEDNLNDVLLLKPLKHRRVPVCARYCRKSLKLPYLTMGITTPSRDPSFMKPDNPHISACRHCKFYAPEGRRGGQCQKLNVAVQSQWEACALATSPFTPTWEALEGIMQLQRQTIAVQELAISTYSMVVEESEVAEHRPTRLEQMSGY